MIGTQAFAENTQEASKKILSDMEKLQDSLFMAPVIPLPEVNYEVTEEEDMKGMEKWTKTKHGTPLFKKMRIRVQNYYRLKEHEDKIREAKEAEEELKRLEQGDLEETEAKPKAKFSFFKKKKTEEIKTEQESGEELQKSPDTIELSGNVQEQVAPKDVQLDCDIVQYYEERNEVEATGHPVLYFPPQDITLKADKIVYNSTSNIIKAYGNVEIIKDGGSIFGDFIQVNLNEETSLMTNITADKMKMIIRAKNAKSGDNQIVLEDGDMHASEPYIARFKTKMLGVNFGSMMIDEDDRSYLDKAGTAKIDLTTDEITVDAEKQHNIMTLKNANLSYNDKHLVHFDKLKIYTNKNNEYFEANYPEFGSRSRLGAFAGPGFVFKTPFDSTVKLVPFVNYKGGFGLGGAIKYQSATNYTEAMYGSAEDIFIARGKQQFDDKFYMQYGINSYVDDWWMGNRMAKYSAELVYNDGKRIKNFFGPKKDLSFKNRISAGYMEDNDKARYDSKNMTSTGMGTTRFKYMAEALQTIYDYKNEEKLRALNLALAMQGSAALYGNGDTQFVGRIGPRLHTQYRYWMQDIGYYMSAYQDDSPMPMFDAYRYGHANIYIKEALRVNKYLTVAYSTSINLTDDAPNKKHWQENAFIIAVGPDDFKVNLGYDFLRQNTYFGVNIALDTKKTHVDFDKMIIKNPDRLANNEKEVKEISFEQTPAQKINRTYAKVIEIEDPDREQL